LRQKGYYYGAPQRQYVESTRAHNTVEADGEDHDRRNRKPYGSAIVDAEERAGHFRLRAQVDHGDWLHQRSIVFRPGEWLYVVDTLTATDDGTHDFRAWWNMPASALPQRVGESLFKVEGLVDPLWVVELGGSPAIDPVSGQEDPLRGWRSRKDLEFTPAWSLGFEALATTQHEFRTLFSFGPQPPSRAPAIRSRGAAMLTGSPPRAPYVVAAVRNLTVTAEPVWVPCDLSPGETYRLRALVDGGDQTEDNAALIRVDATSGTGLSVSASVGAYRYLRTGPGVHRTDRVFTVDSPAHRVGLQAWGHRGDPFVQSLTIERVAGADLPASFFLSFDVEAGDDRCDGDPIDSLVWGRLGGAELRHRPDL
jgi:hypothetical protein